MKMIIIDQTKMNIRDIKGVKLRLTERSVNLRKLFIVRANSNFINLCHHL